MNYYKEFRFIPIYNFYEIYRNKDIRYLLKLDDYSDLPELKENELLILTDTFRKISDECLEKLGIDGGNEILDCDKSIVIFQLKKIRINNIVQILRMKYYPGIKVDHEYLETEIKNAGYRLVYSNEQEFYNALDMVCEAAKGIDNRINEKEEEKKDIENGLKNIQSSYMDSVLAIHEGLGIKLDIYKDTMLYYATCVKRLKIKSKKIEEYNNSIKNKQKVA